MLDWIVPIISILSEREVRLLTHTDIQKTLDKADGALRELLNKGDVDDLILHESAIASLASIAATVQCHITFEREREGGQ
jgi:hypothetical protein